MLKYKISDNADTCKTLSIPHLMAQRQMTLAKNDKTCKLVIHIRKTLPCGNLQTNS